VRQTLKNLLKKLLSIEDTPRRTALAFSVGVFLGFSPFLGLHTVAGIAIAFMLRLNRLAVLLGVWSNTPWWLLPYYTAATWLGTKVIGFQIEETTLRGIFRSGMDQGFFSKVFWGQMASQWGLLLSFLIGSSLLAGLFALVVYPISLRWITFCRSRKCS
jgi:uncharacterized protein